MSGPERIYRGQLHTGRTVYQDVTPDEAQTVWPWREYLRADLHQSALRAAREAALREAADVCTDYGFSRADECRDEILALIDGEKP
jgi:hypothetical protein